MDTTTESGLHFQPVQINFREPFTQHILPFQDEINPLQVTRATFADFITKSFAVSHGMLNAQMVYFAWIAKQTGQDIQTMLDTFVHVGIDTLTTSELEHMKKPFERVQAHAESVTKVATSQEQYDDIFNYQLWKYLKFCAVYGFDDALQEQGITQEDLAHMTKADIAIKVAQMKEHKENLKQYAEGSNWQMEYLRLHQHLSETHTRG